MSWLPLGEWDKDRARRANLEALHFEVENLRHIVNELDKAGAMFLPKTRVARDFIRAYDDCL